MNDLDIKVLSDTAFSEWYDIHANMYKEIVDNWVVSDICAKAKLEIPSQPVTLQQLTW